MNKISIQYVTQEELHLVWPVASGLLELALEKEGYGSEISEVLVQLETQYIQLWLALLDRTIVGAVVAELRRYPEHLVARILLTGGTQGSKWEEQLMQTVEVWAKSRGADVLEVQGRPGWGRRLRKYGLVPHSVTLQKNLETVH